MSRHLNIQKIKHLPLIGTVLKRLKQFIYKPEPWSVKYWENRYINGGNSGAGSYSNLAQFKAEIINCFVEKNHVNSVIEFGCGDGNQLKLFHFKKYIGFDVSREIIDVCKRTFTSDNSKAFFIMSSYKNEKADLTLSLDVIYHLVEDKVFEKYMKILFASSSKHVIIYSSNTNDNTFNEAKHIRHRKFSNWIEKNKPDFELIEYIPNKYPYRSDNLTNSFADFYFFKKKELN